jgi:membrane fusion protein, multidrug efflux system
MRRVESTHDESTALTIPTPKSLEALSGPIDVTSPLKEARPVRRSSWRGIILAFAAAPALLAGGVYFAPAAQKAIRTISTDNAYVDGHITFVAPRITGRVARVLVEDNTRVSKGDLLVELDHEPYQIQVDIKKAAVANADAEVRAAEAQARAALGRLRNLSWTLKAATEEVHNAVAVLKARVAALRSKEATFDRARSDFKRAESLLRRGAISREEFDQRLETMRVAEACFNQSREEVFQARVFLGLAPHPETGDLTDVPGNLDQTFSGVRRAMADVVQCTAQLGLPWIPTTKAPSDVLAEFINGGRQPNLDRMMEHIVSEAPDVCQAVTKRLQAERDLAHAEMNLRDCEVRADIDGVIVRRNVNPGNNVTACQSVMAIRSLTEIWIDANFKETQLADLKIGQRADIEVDMYGGRKVFRGRVTGFTMGTGQTLAILPAQNATGNFVKVVQRLPVRIELEDYDPERNTLFAGLSVTPYVYINEEPRGPWAGQRLQGFSQRTSTCSK